jgi:BlaI family penicillinase repressor
VRSRRRNVTETELAVLKSLWSRGPSTIRALTDLLYPDGGISHYGTVQKLLDRLEEKGCVQRTRGARINVYSAAVGRAEMVGRRLRETADQLCDGSMTPLLTHLVGASDLSPDEVEALRELVVRLDREADEERPR